MQDQYEKARHLPSRMVDFEVKHLNIWSYAADRWLDLKHWKRAEVPDLDLDARAGESCYLGLDLAEVNDMSALAALFPGADGVWRSCVWYWCPEEDILQRERGDKVPYHQWERAGYLLPTPGSATDFDFIEARIRELIERLKVKELLYDRWKSTSIVQNLTRDSVATCVPYGQGYKDASPALKEIERRLLNGTLQLQKNPILNWNAANAEVAMDPAGNIKLLKKSPRKRIDGLSALANAVGGALLNNETDGPSVYEERGVIEL